MHLLKVKIFAVRVMWITLPRRVSMSKPLYGGKVRIWCEINNEIDDRKIFQDISQGCGYLKSNWKQPSIMNELVTDRIKEVFPY